MEDGRKTNTTNNSKGVHKRGDGLGTGPVGRQDGYAGRKTGSSGSSSPRVTRGKTPLIVVILMLLLGGGGGLGAMFGNSDGNDTSTGSSYVQEAPSNTNGGSASSSTGTNASQGGLDLYSLFGGGFSGQTSTAGWQNGSDNTAKLDTTVASNVPDKRTKILGNGQDTVTIMVYMCGTDLESKYGMATNDMKEMAAANLSDNVNVIIYTGGCTAWKLNGVSNKVNQIYKVTNHNLERLVEDDGDKVMTNPKTLSSFIQYCNKNYPANRNELIFWDHGGGSISGYGYDEKHKAEGSMKLSQIDSALKEAGVTFDFIGFDACLMATLENGYMCSDYADYLIASEETEPGIGWYYTTWLNELSKNTSMPTIEIGKNIVDGFVDECARSCQGQKTTLSVIDLAELKTTVPESLVSFSNSTADLIKSDEYKVVSDARASAREFSTSKIDQIDLVNFAENIGTEEAKALSKKLQGAVKYNRTSSNMTNAYGISIYFPYRKTSNVNSAVSMNNTVGIDGAYNDCIKAFAGLETTGQIASGGTTSPIYSLLGGTNSNGASGSDAISSLLNSFLSGGRDIPGIDRDASQYLAEMDQDEVVSYISMNQFDGSKLVWNVENGSHTMTLQKEQWQLVQSIQQNMFYDDGEGYIDLGLDNVYHFTEDGVLVGDTDNTWIAIDGQPVAYYYDETIILSGDGSTGFADGDLSNKVITGHVPVLLDGQYRANLIINFDASNPNGYIAGARFDYAAGQDQVDDENRTEAKGIVGIEEGTLIDYLCDYYTYSGDYSDSYYLGEQVTYRSGMQISNVDVMGKTKITYLLTDMYNNEFWTEAIDQQ